MEAEQALKDKIVVTGGTGFLGSWVIRILINDFDVIALVRPSSNTYRISDLKNLTVAHRDESEWGGFIEKTKPHALLLFDWSGVQNIDRNSSIQRENLERWIEVASAAKRAGTALVIGVGSQAEVGPHEAQILEDEIDNPTNEYALAKVEARVALQEIFRNSPTRLLWLRVFSTYGPMDSPSWLIPSMIDTFNEGKSFDLTAGDQQWSYLHSLDLARAVKMLLGASEIGGIVNVGNESMTSIRNVAMEVASLMNTSAAVNFGWVDYRDDQVMTLNPRCSKLESIGWVPVVSLQAGLIQTIEWFSRKKVHPLTLKNGEVFSDSLPLRP
jgi:UDP-glucose 4-epimerase